MVMLPCSVKLQRYSFKVTRNIEISSEVLKILGLSEHFFKNSPLPTQGTSRISHCIVLLGLNIFPTLDKDPFNNRNPVSKFHV